MLISVRAIRVRMVQRYNIIIRCKVNICFELTNIRPKKVLIQGGQEGALADTHELLVNDGQSGYMLHVKDGHSRYLYTNITVKDNVYRPISELISV